MEGKNNDFLSKDQRTKHKCIMKQFMLYLLFYIQAPFLYINFFFDKTHELSTKNEKQTTVKRVSIQELYDPLYLNINKRSLFQFQ